MLCQFHRRQKHLVVPIAFALWMSVVTPSASAQLYSQDFEVDSTATWEMAGASGPSDEVANFFFDYAGFVAPNGAGTHGMKLQANLTMGNFSGMSVTPNGQSFTGDYIVRFDWWHNFHGPFPAGGIGSTNLSTFGIGTSGGSAQWPGEVASVLFAATGDGNSVFDYRAYSSAAPAGYPSGSPVYAAPGGAVNSSDPYYSVFGGGSAPAAQLALFPQQTGTVAVGAPGMMWHRVRIRKSGNIATWTVDGRLIATVDLNTVTLGGSNIFFGHSDVNAASAPPSANASALLFTLIDNILVTRPADINGDGSVGVADLLTIISNWGACPAPPNLNGCSSDIAPTPAGDGNINIADLLFVINNWG
jgi:hypothetical protein